MRTWAGGRQMTKQLGCRARNGYDRAQEEATMKPFEKCPLCGGELVAKKVEKPLRGGRHTAVVHVRAEVCLHCGERLYDQQTARRFQEIRDKLSHRQTGEFRRIGQSFEVAVDE